jgi:serine/threonine protein kinase
MLLANAILQNRYRVIRELGHGGMGTVYEALDQRLNCTDALRLTELGARRKTEKKAARRVEEEARGGLIITVVVVTVVVIPLFGLLLWVGLFWI